MASPSLVLLTNPNRVMNLVTHFTFATLASAGISRRRVSVSVSVCLLHAGIVSKRLNAGSGKYCRLLPANQVRRWTDDST